MLMSRPPQNTGGNVLIVVVRLVKSVFSERVPLANANFKDAL